MSSERFHTLSSTFHVYFACALFVVGTGAHAMPWVTNDDGEGNYTVSTDPCSTQCSLQEKLHGTTSWVEVADDGSPYVATDKPLGVHTYRFFDVEIDYEYGTVYTYESPEVTVTVGPTDPGELLERLEDAVEPYFIAYLNSLGATSAQKAQAQVDLESVANEIAQKPGALYENDELVVLYKLRILKENDSQFQNGFPGDIPELMTRYDELTDWILRDL